MLRNMKIYLTKVFKSESGLSITGVASALVGVTVLGQVIAGLWDTFVGTDTTIQALTGVDVGTVLLQAVWPSVLIAGAAAIVIGVIRYVFSIGGGS